MYTHVSKCKTYKIKGEKKRKVSGRTSGKDRWRALHRKYSTHFLSQRWCTIHTNPKWLRLIHINKPSKH
jgi:hypothetical protein